MQKKPSLRSQLILFGIMSVPFIWLALVIAPYSSGGLPTILEHLEEITAHPYRIQFCAQTPKVLLALLAIYAFAVMCYLSTRRNYRKGVEHGSASWGDPAKLNRKYRQKPAENNRILTQKVQMGTNAQKHGRNLNTLIVGATGTGKSRAYAFPNLMQANTSFVVTDPKGELLRNSGSFLAEQGYKIRVLDLIHLECSHCYNPFVYLEKEEDVQRLVTNFFKASGVKNGGGDMKFWEDMAQTYLKAMIFFLLEECPPEDQNFASVCTLINEDEVPDEGQQQTMPSPTGALFDNLKTVNPNSLALRYYTSVHQGAAKTIKSVQVSLISHLEKFNLAAMQKLVKVDEMRLDKVGKEKTALFCVIPDNDTSFNFMVSMLYTQLFQKLFRTADDEFHGGLPVPVHFLMDEFANVALPDDFDKILSVMRSRNVSVSVIVQTLSQLKTLYKDNWETIAGNMDELLFLGGNEQTTTEYLSKRLGKETIDVNTYGQSKGRNGSFSTNYQQMGRELMTPDEIGKMDNKYALLFIRGEKPIMDEKYDLNRHPNASRIIGTKSSNAKPYLHGETELAEAHMELLEVHKVTTASRQEPPKKRSNSKQDEIRNRQEADTHEQVQMQFLLLDEDEAANYTLPKKETTKTTKKQEETQNEQHEQVGQDEQEDD
jgi:type IV secretion system protein VirD4